MIKVKISEDRKVGMSSLAFQTGRFIDKFWAAVEDKEKGGVNMARNLKEENADKVKENQKKTADLVEDAPQVQVITSEQLTQSKLDYLIGIVHDGFKQVGVEFKPEEKK